MATRHYTRRNAVDTNDLDGPVAQDVVMPRSGAFTMDDVPEIEVATDSMPAIDEWAAAMRFMEEPVQIRLHDTSDPNAEPRVPVWVNGEIAHPKYGNHLPRGEDIIIKRKFAEQLARAKPINVKTVKTVDQDGNDTSRIVRSIGSQYPFELTNPKPRDLEWLKRIRAEL